MGDKQCSHEHLENLSGSRLGSKSTVKNLKGCTANISEDQTQPRFVNTSLITRIISALLHSRKYFLVSDSTIGGIVNLPLFSTLINA